MTQRGDKPMIGDAPQTRVVISNLKRDVDEEALAALCRQLGRVTNFRLSPGHSPDSPITAIVEYATPEEARDVVDHVDGRLILGQPVTANVTASGQARAPYSSGMEGRNVDHPQGKDGGPSTYGRYPRPQLNEPPRQFQTPPFAGARPWEQDQRAAERVQPSPQPTGFSEDFPHSQQQPPWTRHLRREKVAGSDAPRFLDDGHHNPRASDNPRTPSQQWQIQSEVSREADSLQWERDGRRGSYPTQRASHGEHPEFHSHSSSSWPAGTDARPPVYVANGAVSSQRPLLPPGRVPGGGDSRGPPGIAPHDLRGGNGYVDGDAEGVSVGKRRKRSPQNDGRGTPGPGHSASTWREGPRNQAPPQESAEGEPAPIRDPDFDREVMRQAALLVAERELRVRENARKQTNTEPVRRDDPELQGREHMVVASNASMGNRGSRSLEDSDRRKRAGPGSRERTQRDSRDRDARSVRNAGKGFDNQAASAVGGRDWREDKRSHRDDSPHKAVHGRIDEREDKVRVDAGANERRGPPDRKYSIDNGGSNMNKHRDDEKWSHKDRRDEHRVKRDSRSRTSNSSRDPDRGTSRADKTWERGNKPTHMKVEGHARRPDDRDAPREAALGPSLNKNWEQSSADSGWYVHVGGISFSTTFTALAKRFAAFGDVNGFKVIFNNVTCRAADADVVVGGVGGHDQQPKKDPTKAAVVTASTGFAFISFDDKEGMERAVECMNNQVLDGHVLKVSRGRMHGDSITPKPRPPAVKPDRRWPPPDGTQEFNKYYNTQQQHYQPSPQDRTDRRAALAINHPAPFPKKSWTGAVPSSTAFGPAGSRQRSGEGGNGVGGHAASTTNLFARPAGASRVSAPGASRAEFNGKKGDRRDARDAAGRSRQGNSDVFGGYGMGTGAMGDGGGSKPKREIRGDVDGFRARARGGGVGSSKDAGKRVNKKGVKGDARPRDGQAGPSVAER